MKLTAKGIGWLIAGLIICASATESYGIAAKLSTIALGLVFVAIYLMKQIFVPRGIGWFIAGGVLVAFVVEEGLTEEGLISVGIAAACLAVFYFRNRQDIDNAAGEWSIEYDSDEEGGVEADPNAAPAYDPDAEIASLSLTIPSWASNILRIKNSANMHETSPEARLRLKKALVRLKSTTDKLLYVLREATDERLQ